MKKLLLFLLVVFLFSCKKEKNSDCWQCQIVQNGQISYQKMCGSKDGLFKDSAGNDLQCIQIH